MRSAIKLHAQHAAFNLDKSDVNAPITMQDVQRALDAIEVNDSEVWIGAYRWDEDQASPAVMVEGPLTATVLRRLLRVMEAAESAAIGKPSSRERNQP